MEQKLTLPDGRQITLRVCQPECYIPNPSNTNKGKERGKAAIDDSLRRSGFHRGIVVASNGEVINGNHAYEAASELGVVKSWIEIEVEGDIGIATKRIDWETAKDPKAVVAAIEDNRTSFLNYEIDIEALDEALGLLQDAGEELLPSVLTQSEIDSIFAGEDKPEEELDRIEKENDRSNKEPQEIICPHCGEKFFR